MERLPRDLVKQIAYRYMEWKDWNSVLRCCKSWRTIFRYILCKQNYKMIGQIFVKGFTGSTITIFDLPLKNSVYWLKLVIIHKLNPSWRGKKGEMNLPIWYRLAYNGKQLENNRSLEHCGLCKECTVHLLGKLGVEHTLKEDIEYSGMEWSLGLHHY